MNMDYLLDALKDLCIPHIFPDGTDLPAQLNAERIHNFVERLRSYTQREQDVCNLIRISCINEKAFPCTAEDCLFNSLKIMCKYKLDFSVHLVTDIMACYCILSKYGCKLHLMLRIQE